MNWLPRTISCQECVSRSSTGRYLYKMICKNSIEEKIIQLQAKKRLLSEELIKEEEGFVKQLSEEDLEFLLA